MSGVAKNGRRAVVAFGKYAGAAGVQDRHGGVIEVAFRAELRGLRGIEEGTVDGKPVEVLSVAKSDWVAGMAVVTCQKAKGAECDE